MQIIRGKIESAQKVVIYGPEGIGKSYFASRFPNPLFIDTEGSTKHMDVARLPNPSSWSMLLEQVKYFMTNPNACDTLVIDTADWAERLCIDEICAKAQKKGIEDFGYGKGYTYLAEEFGRLLNSLTELIDQGINVCLVAHAQMRKFEQPDEMGAYDRWEMKLQKKVYPLVKEWADMVLFANYKTHVINVDGQGAAKGVNKVQGGKRVMYTTHHPCWDAKNRHDLLPELDLHYSEIAHCIPIRQQTINKPRVSIPDSMIDSAGVGNTEIKGDARSKSPQPEPIQVPEIVADPQETVTSNTPAIDPVIPKPLADLMTVNNVTMDEIRQVVADRGYYPADMPFDKYDPDFVKGCLIGAWDQVFQMIKDNREIPF